MRTTMIALSILALISMGGCSDDDNPTTPSSDPLIFVISVEITRVSQDEYAMYVVLAMETPGQVPSFRANGEEVPYFSMYGDHVRGFLSLPLADTIEFTISSLNRTISGAIDVPQEPEVVTLNGVELVTGQGNVVEATGHYEYAWSGGLADFYDCFMELYDQESGPLQHRTKTAGEEWTVEEPNGNPRSFSIVARTGSRGEPGEDPLYTSSWAEGYAFARSNGAWFNLDTPVSQAGYPVEKSAMDRLEELLNDGDAASVGGR